MIRMTSSWGMEILANIRQRELALYSAHRREDTHA